MSREGNRQLNAQYWLNALIDKIAYITGNALNYQSALWATFSILMFSFYFHLLMFSSMMGCYAWYAKKYQCILSKKEKASLTSKKSSVFISLHGLSTMQAASLTPSAALERHWTEPSVLENILHAPKHRHATKWEFNTEFAQYGFLSYTIPQLLWNPDDCHLGQQSRTRQWHASSQPCVRTQSGGRRWGRPWQWHRRMQTHLNAHTPSRGETNTSENERIRGALRLEKLSASSTALAEVLSDLTGIHHLLHKGHEQMYFWWRYWPQCNG